MKKIILYMILCIITIFSLTGCKSGKLFEPDPKELLEGFIETGGDISFLSRVAAYDLSKKEDVVIRVNVKNGISKIDYGGKVIEEKYYEYKNNKLVIVKKFFSIFPEVTDKKLSIYDKNGTKAFINLVIATKVISTPQDFLAINASNNTLAGYYVLGNDLDFEGIAYTMIGNKSDDNETDLNVNSFKGLFEGAGFSIKNVTINRVFSGTETDKGYIAGLFRSIGGTGIVRNLSVKNIDVCVSGGIGGGIAGKNSGYIQNVYVEGKVTRSSSASGNEPCGGVVGFSDGEVNNCVAYVQVDGFTICGGNFKYVIDCKAFATVDSRLDDIGGYRHVDAERQNDKPEGFEVKNQYVFGMYSGQESGNENFESIEEFKKPLNFESYNKTIWKINEGETIQLYKMFLPN